MPKSQDSASILLFLRGEELETSSCNLLAQRLRERPNPPRNLLRARLQQKLDGRAQAGDDAVRVGAGFEFPSAIFKLDLPLRDDVWVRRRARVANVEAPGLRIAAPRSNIQETEDALDVVAE